MPELCSSLLPPPSMRLLGKFDFLEITVVAQWPEERGQVLFLRIFLSSTKTVGRSQTSHSGLFFLPNQSLDGASLCPSSCSLNKCFLFFFTHFCSYFYLKFFVCGFNFSSLFSLANLAGRPCTASRITWNKSFVSETLRQFWWFFLAKSFLLCLLWDVVMLFCGALTGV